MTEEKFNVSSVARRVTLLAGVMFVTCDVATATFTLMQKGFAGERLLPIGPSRGIEEEAEMAEVGGQEAGTGSGVHLVTDTGKSHHQGEDIQHQGTGKEITCESEVAKDTGVRQEK